MNFSSLVSFVILPIVVWFTLWLLFRIFKVKGFRSYRGVVLFLLSLLGVICSWLAANLFLPLTPIVIFIIEVVLLKYINHLTWGKALLISLLYTLEVLAIMTIIMYVLVGA